MKLPPRRRVAPLLLLFAAAACAATAPTPPPGTPPAKAPVAVAGPTVAVPPVGEVKPAPEGSASLVFFAPGDDQRAVRNTRGRIADVLAANGRKEPVLARISFDEIESLVPRIAEIIADGDPEPISHIPSFYSQGHIPGPPAWAYLQRYLKEGDEFWTYGDGETGLLVIRDNHLLCMMTIKIPFEN